MELYAIRIRLVVTKLEFPGKEYQHLRTGEIDKISDQEQIGEYEIFQVVQLCAEARNLFPQIDSDNRSRNVIEDIEEGFDPSFLVHWFNDRIPAVPLWHAANKGILSDVAVVFP